MAEAEASDFTFGNQSEFVKFHLKIHSEEKWVWVPSLFFGKLTI